MANESKDGSLELTSFWPQYLISMFAAQRTLKVGENYDGAGICKSIRLLTSGTVIVVFKVGAEDRRMAVTAGGWGWL